MIDKRVYELDYIRELQKKYVSDPGLQPVRQQVESASSIPQTLQEARCL